MESSLANSSRCRLPPERTRAVTFEPRQCHVELMERLIRCPACRLVVEQRAERDRRRAKGF